MTAGLARHALRRHRWSLLGPACTQGLAALVIAAMVDAAASINDTLTPAQLASPEVVDALDVTAVFLGDTVYLGMTVIGVTMALAASRQLRDLALVRTVGASPAQVRRALLVQAVVVAVPAAVVGSVAGVPAAWLWVGSARSHGVLPAEVGFVHPPLGIVLAVAVVLVTSVIATLVAVVRISRLSPAAALVEVTGDRRVSRVRVVAGAVLVLAGAGLSIVLAAVALAQTDDAAVFILLGESVGVGLLGPVALAAVSRGLTAVCRDGLTRLAVDDLRVLARSLSGALVPLVLAMSFAGIKLAAHTSSPPGRPVGPADGAWVDAVGSSLLCGFAVIAAVNCIVTVVVGHRQTLAAMQLVGASRHSLVAVALLQTAVVTAVAALASAAIVVVTLAPVLHHALGRWLPHVPVPAVGALVAGLGVVVGAAFVVPVARVTSAPPIHWAATAG